MVSLRQISKHQKYGKMKSKKLTDDIVKTAVFTSYSMIIYISAQYKLGMGAAL